jgi:pyruvate-ferredoxin/flavodoxin oxidoreductase
MWLGKSRSPKKEVRYPGYPHALDGHAAAYAAETAVSDAVVIQSATDMAELTGPLRNLAPPTYDPISGRRPAVRYVDELRSLLAQVTGYAAAGLRTGAMVSQLSAAHDAVYAAAGKRLSCVIALTCKAARRQAASLQGAHDDYYAVAGSGAFQLFAKDAQEVADFTLIAHRVAELSLTPGVCAQDFYQTSQAVQNVLLPGRDLVDVFLGRSNDVIASPTPSQTILFGERRRRVPALIDPDFPAGLGGVQDGDAYYKAFTGQHPFFSAHLAEILEAALEEFGELTGRRYHSASEYRAEDADYLVIAQGAVVDSLIAVVDYLRESRRLKVGLVNMSVYRPFPGAQLTRLLKGKKAVTVLERTGQSLAEDGPLAREVRSALDKASENAVREDHPVFEEYDVYRRPSDRPNVYTGVYGVGGSLPSLDELVAVFENMVPAGDRTVEPKRFFYIGADVDRPTRRFPHLQSLQQRLRRDYPDLGAIVLSAPSESIRDNAPPEVLKGSIAIHSLSLQGVLFAGNLFAQTMADSMDRRVRTFPSGGMDPGLVPTRFSLSYTGAEHVGAAPPETFDTVLATSQNLLETVSSRASIRMGGTIVIGSNRDPDKLWRGLSRRTRRWVRDIDARVYVVDVAGIAAQVASRPSFVDQLTVWTLLGAALSLDAEIGSNGIEQFTASLRTRLEELFGEGHYLIDDIVSVVGMGAERIAELDTLTLPAEETSEANEPEAPWTVQRLEAGDDTVFDPARFWRSVGFLYDQGEAQESLIDPYVTTGVVPGGSSAYRDMTPFRLGVPKWLAENCTGCGLCWAHCPDTALPPTIQPVSVLIQHAMSQCEKDGVAMVQMTRIADHLAKTTYKIISKDDLRQYTTMGPLLREAFSQLVEKMKLGEDKVQPLQTEFDQVCGRMEHHPFVRTERFFDGPQAETKGSGHLLSITLNPLSCKGCRLCVEVCPEHAFEWVAQTQEYLETARSNWRWQLGLPSVPGDTIEAFVSADDTSTEINRLLDKHAYHSIVGGDSAPPGQSAKAAVHLVTAAVESVMRPRFESHVEHLTSLIQKLEDKMQGKVTQAVEINDFESFGKQLERLGKNHLTPEQLAALAGEGRDRVVDPVQLKRLNELLGRLKEQRRRYTRGTSSIERAGGAGRARMMMTIDPGGAAFWSGTYPDNPLNQPWLSHTPGDAPALAEGVFEGATRSLAEELKDCRLAQLELDDAYKPAEHDTVLNRFDWEEFTEEEKGLIPPIVVLAHTGVTGWDDVYRLLARRFPARVLVINTTAIPSGMTGMIGSSPSPGTNERRTVSRKSNDPGILALARRGVYVLQSTVGHPGHLIRGVVRGLSRPYPALFHVHAPDPHSAGIAPEKVADQATLAYTSRAFPLFEADPERKGPLISLDGNPDPNEDWTTRELEFVDASGRKETLTVPVTVADWAIGEARFLDSFNIYSKGHLNDGMKSLPEYFELDHDQRQAFEPIVQVRDEKRRHLVAVLSPDMSRAVEERLKYWRFLRELASDAGANIGSARATAASTDAATVTETPAEPPAQELPAPGPELDRALHEKLSEKLLWLSGFSQDPDFFKQSLREFLVRKREADAGPEQSGTDSTPE